MKPESLRWAARTDTGRVRTQNEDSVHADGTVFVVADGMGGHLAGEVASTIAVAAIVEACASGVSSAEDLADAVRVANRRVIEESSGDPTREGMGTTVVAAVRVPDNDSSLALVNVGDSRAYRFDGQTLHQLSKDHSLVQELVDDGLLAPDDARHHPRRNIVTRALGIDPNVEIDLWQVPLTGTDRLLLCSDGLVDEVDEDLIAEVLTTEPDPERAADRLIELANAHGGRDNISMVLVQAAHVSDVSDPTVEMIVVDRTPPASPSTESSVNPLKSRRMPTAKALVVTAVFIVLTACLAISVATIRSGYRVVFDSEDRVVVLKGHDFLWFDPTFVARGPLSKGELDTVSRDLVENEPRFADRTEAEDFVASRLSGTETRTTLGDE